MTGARGELTSTASSASVGPPTVEPVVAGHQPVAGEPAQDRIASRRQRLGQVVELTVAAAQRLDAGDARAALRLEAMQAGGDIGTWRAQEAAQHQPIFEGNGTSLRQVR